MALVQQGWYVSYLRTPTEQAQAGPLALSVLREMYQAGTFKASGDDFVVNSAATEGKWSKMSTLAPYIAHLRSAPDAEQIQVCPSCGTRMTTGSRFCSACGYDYTKGPPAGQEKEKEQEQAAAPAAQKAQESKGAAESTGDNEWDNLEISDDEKTMAEHPLQQYAEKYCLMLEASRGLFSSSKKISAEETAAFQEYDKRTFPLQKLPAEAHEAASILWSRVHAFMGTMPDPPKASRAALLQEMVNICTSHSASLKDEALLIVMKQLTSPGEMTPESKTVGYMLLDALLARFGPSPRLRPYLKAFLARCASTQFDDQKRIQMFVREARRSVAFHQYHPVDLAGYGAKRFDFFQQYGFSHPRMDPQQLLLHSSRLSQPLHRLHKRFRADVQKIFAAINRCLEEGGEAKEIAAVINNSKYKDPKGQAFLTNEMYALLIKQSRAKSLEITLNAFAAICELYAALPPRGKAMKCLLLDTCAVQLKLCKSLRPDAAGIRAQIVSHLERNMASFALSPA